MPKLLIAVVVALAGAALTSTAVAGPATSAAARIVVHAKFKSLSRDKLTITYTSAKGRYSATWIGIRHYRLRGRILSRALSGAIRTRQTSGRTRYSAAGSGRLGTRRVRITGGGPNNLRTATLILSPR
jgi:hypothetical protein